MRKKITELSGSALNWAVMSVLGNAPHYINGAWGDSNGNPTSLTLFVNDANLAVDLFEKFMITTSPGRRGDEEGHPTGWTAWAYGHEDGEFAAERLIEAGLRCLVSLLLDSDEIDIPWLNA